MNPIHATYENGVIRPLQPVNLAEGTRAEMIPLASDAAPAQSAVWPTAYFDQTAGAFEGEEFDRPAQGDQPQRENW